MTPQSVSSSTPSAGVADLHTHTFYSDGTDSPERLVELAKELGFSTVAITDHDTMESLPIAQPVAKRLGIALVPGIEMSASAEGLEVHMLGFFLDPAHRALQQHLTQQQARRVERVKEMVRRLGQIGVTIDADEVFKVAGAGTVGRPHVAQVLVNRGYIATRAEAFSKYIGPDNPGFVPGSPIAPARIIQLIVDAGGVPVLAHPIYLKRDELIETFMKQGLVGLEVYHSGHTPEMIKHYDKLADRLGLLKTGGSDYHGTSKEGSPIGAVKVPCALVDALRQWKETHPATRTS